MNDIECFLCTEHIGTKDRKNRWKKWMKKFKILAPMELTL